MRAKEKDGTKNPENSPAAAVVVAQVAKKANGMIEVVQTVQPEQQSLVEEKASKRGEQAGLQTVQATASVKEKAKEIVGSWALSWVKVTSWATS